MKKHVQIINSPSLCLTVSQFLWQYIVFRFGIVHEDLFGIGGISPKSIVPKFLWLAQTQFCKTSPAHNLFEGKTYFSSHLSLKAVLGLCLIVLS